MMAILVLSLSMTSCSCATTTPTEAPTEEQTEEQAEEPAEEQAEEPDEEQAEEAAEKPAEEPTEEPVEEPERMTYSEPPAMTIDVTKTYIATIETVKGDVVCELFAADVPVTVNNFVFLANEGFYDNITFHRVIAGFMAQGGDPTGTGRGGPGYSFEDEFTSHKHGTGALSMANAGPNTNGSQFFITYAPQPHLDGHHSVFGQLIEGMDVLEQIKTGDGIKTIKIAVS